MTKKPLVDPFDTMIAEMQEEIDAKDSEDFSPYALRLGVHPYHNTPLDSVEHVVSEVWQGPCGDAIRWYLEIIADTITKAHFTTTGCTTSTIAGSQSSLMIEMKTIDDAYLLSEAEVLNALGKFPQADHHCVTLALTALRLTLDKYRSD